MSYRQLTDLATGLPGCRAASSALATLRRLARDGDFAAELAIGAVLAREFLLAGPEDMIEADEPEQLLSREDIPAIARLLVLGSYPRIIFSSPEAIAGIAAQCSSPSLFRRFQWLVYHDAPIQDEALRAFLLVIVAGGSRFGKDHLAVSPAGYSGAFKKIAGSARVAQGQNADTSFEVGRDLILRGGFMGLHFAIHHELGHWIMEHLASDLRMDPGDPGLDAFAAVVPELFRVSPDSPEPHRLEPGSGITVLCSALALDDETAAHLSFSVSGSPVDLQWASQAALLAMRAHGIDPLSAAVAYSGNGVFHVGFFGTPRLSPDWAAPEAGQARQPGLPADAASWIDSMRECGRFGRSEQDCLFSLKPAARPAMAYAPYQTSWDEAGLCDQLRPGMDPAALPAGATAGLAGVALRCTDAAALRWLLGTLAEQPGQAVARDQRLGLEYLGLNCGVIRDGDRSLCYGATAEGARAVIAELHEAGLDVNEPVSEDGATLLIEAAGRSAEFVRFLLAHGADPDASDHAGRTALAAAAAMGNAEAVEDLIRSGADPDAVTDLGRAPIHSVLDAWDADSRTRIIDALAAAGAAIDEETSDGTTALMLAAARACPETAARLIAHGADVNARSRAGETPLTRVGAERLPFLTGSGSGWAPDEVFDELREETTRILLEAGALPPAS